MSIYNSDILGLQCINNKLTAHIFHNGTSVRSYECEESITDENDLAARLSEVMTHCNFNGHKVSMVIVSPSIEYQILTIPSLKRKNLTQHLAWKAHSLKGDDYIWSYTRLKSTRTQTTVCLHLVPKIYQTAFIGFCQSNNLEPLHLITVAAVIPHLLSVFDTGDDKLTMLTIVLDSVMYIVVGTKNLPLFIREISLVLTTVDPESYSQFSREMKRTVLFTKKQYNKDIGQLKIVGSNLEYIREALSDIDILTPEFDERTLNFLEYTVLSPCKRPDNFVPIVMTEVRTQMKKWLGILCLIIIFCLTLIAAFIYVSRVHEKVKQQVLQSNIHEELSQLEATLDTLQTLQRSINTNRNTIRYIDTYSIDPIPCWFTLYVTNILPPALTLSHLVIEKNREQQYWNITIEGFCPAKPNYSARILKQFEDTLTTGDAHFTPVMPWNTQWLHNFKSGNEDFSTPGMNHFIITGRVR